MSKQKSKLSFLRMRSLPAREKQEPISTDSRFPRFRGDGNDKSRPALILIGGGGHSKVIIDAVRARGGFNLYGVVDPGLQKGASLLGIPVIGSDDALPGIFNKGLRYAFIAVGSIGNWDIRKKIYDNLKSIGFKLPIIVHPKAIVAKSVSVGEGTFIAARAVINPETRIGKNVIVNTSSSIDHDCIIGDFVHIAPGATLSGGVKIGYGTHIGIGANIIQNIIIARGCMIGAGEVVRRNVMASNVKYVSQYVKTRRIFIIAEAGVNHNGRMETARKMIDVAKQAGADAVKFQSFKAERIVSKFEKSQLKMLKELELDEAAHKELIGYSKKKDIEFLSSPFDLESIELLNTFELRIFKIPSGEITNRPYLNKIGSLRKKIIISTGMASLNEIEEALHILIKAGTPKKDITVLHCNTEYPTPYKDVNLQAMLTIRNAFGVNIGYSDHTPGIEIPVAAAALGADVIEKHFTLDKNMEGPDHKASLDPIELKVMVKAIRNVEKAFGDGIKRPSSSESKNKEIVRKSIVATRDINKGEPFTEESITTKRPASGISPLEWDNVMGKLARRDFKEDELIEL